MLSKLKTIFSDRTGLKATAANAREWLFDGDRSGLAKGDARTRKFWQKIAELLEKPVYPHCQIVNPTPVTCRVGLRAWRLGHYGGYIDFESEYLAEFCLAKATRGTWGFDGHYKRINNCLHRVYVYAPKSEIKAALLGDLTEQFTRLATTNPPRIEQEQIRPKFLLEWQEPQKQIHTPKRIHPGYLPEWRKRFRSLLLSKKVGELRAIAEEFRGQGYCGLKQVSQLPKSKLIPLLQEAMQWAQDWQKDIAYKYGCG